MTIKDNLIKAARTIRHCGDYGLLFFNPRTREAHWTGADSDGEPEYTSMKDVQRILKVPGVAKVVIGDEWSPDEDEGWQRIRYDKDDGDSGAGVAVKGKPSGPGPKSASRKETLKLMVQECSPGQIASYLLE
jgi:hypothetical protein